MAVHLGGHMKECWKLLTYNPGKILTGCLSSSPQPVNLPGSTTLLSFPPVNGYSLMLWVEGSLYLLQHGLLLRAKISHYPMIFIQMFSKRRMVFIQKWVT